MGKRTDRKSSALTGPVHSRASTGAMSVTRRGRVKNARPSRAGLVDIGLRSAIDMRFKDQFGLDLTKFFATQSMRSIHAAIQHLPSLAAILILEELVIAMEADPDRFRHNDPDAAHNLAMHANEVDRNDLGFRICKICCDAIIPGNVDLLTDLLQEYFTHHWDEEMADRTWKRLQSVDERVRSKYWRYWVYGARYYVRMKDDVKASQRLLLKGIELVQGDGKAHLYEELPDVFIDFAPVVNQRSIQGVINRLQEGIRSGLGRSYNLSTELAILEQRLVGQHVGNNKEEARRKHLEQALRWLDLAEALFTADSQHPITAVYSERVNVLMGLDRYREAIEYIAAIINTTEEKGIPGSMKAQLIVACFEDGKPDNYWKSLVGDEQGITSLDRLKTDPEGRG